jgi:NAD(P)-dependent dehydrogenase (short-subunit alcohol dehydrogenase family)
MPGVQDRVVVVTGAGGGLGREYALTLAREGANVVVNDLGGSRDGTGGGSAMADKVVAEIRDAGGRAVANYDSVAEADGAANIIKTALDEFGAVHGVVSNAGILRDGTFHKMTSENWDAVLKVHLYGGYNVIRAAWPHFREQSYGRVVVATSTSGLFGNFGQTNYGAAKMGLVGLSNVLAVEGAKSGIRSNVIAPIAKSRLTEDLLGPLADLVEPDLVMPLSLYLVSEACELTHEIFSVGGGKYSRVFVGETPGWFAGKGTQPTVEDIAANIDQIRAEDGYTVPGNAQDDIRLLLAALG